MSRKVFLSYKSQDAVAVRSIAEQLRSVGLNVWFAEYNIKLDDWQDDKFQDRIDEGILACDYAICFTNDLYTDSGYCRKEIELLLEHLPLENILEVALPRGSRVHAEYPQLSGSPSLEIPIKTTNDCSSKLSPEDIDKILDFISVHIKFFENNQPEEFESNKQTIKHCNYMEPTYAKRKTYRNHGVCYSIDLAGWKAVKPGLLQKIIGWRDLGAMYEWHSPQGSKIWGHVMVGPMDVKRKNMTMNNQKDREYYEESLHYASYFFQQQQRKNIIGNHLLFLDGYSHPAYTIRHSPPESMLMNRQVWHRLYSIVLPSKKHRGNDIEFAFYFFCDGNLATFLFRAHIMDRLVLSLNPE